MLNDERVDTVILTVLAVHTHFECDAMKTLTWFRTQNTNLGGISPEQMIALGREEKLYTWVQTQLEENTHSK